ncbi:Wall-associated receptor kinase 2 [Vitis vinifera]|uniref:Wall-associated receptor kinase 2 n=1 Tax=Vitis vinifera TaxID=29760 RepID=A0A438DQU5_VITVI|nr:Wall-associated receptor kinase 2 [Vitis vinifera]
MMVRLMLVGLLLLASAAAAAATVAQAKEGCLDKCGDVSIPYPFGTNEEQCYLSPYFLVTCNHSSNPPKLLLGKPSPEGNNVQVLDISLDGELLILNYVSHDCYNRSGGLDSLYSYGSHLTPGQFNISSTRNKFTMVGCDTYAWFRGQRGEESYRTGCMSLCDNITAVRNGSCSGNGCCQTSIPDELSDIQSHFTFSSDDLKDLKGIEKLPMVFDWAFGKETCQVVDENSQTNYACKGNSSCNKRKTGWGYLCNCSEGYQGNPYLESGCQDINECENSILNKCENPETCVNTQGNYTCSCPMWYQGDGKIDGQRCIPNRLQMIHAAMGIGIALLVLLVSSTWLFWALKKRRFIKLKKKYFQQNGGSELRQLSRQGSTERIKIFTFEELEKATKKYDESNIIGRGGFGTVYKGTLTDGRIVAIKKSKMVEQSQGKDFINEVGILSQINHRHVIQLLGCCLETQVPLLVYEFINNGTLSDHIHNENKASAIMWETRLRIAIQTAEALYYLHSVASTPIIHRDVKSTNILLDAEYNVKVCDFGASRLVPLDQTQLSTAVQELLDT